MSKGLIIGDPHCTESQIISRVDNVRTTSLNKLGQVIDLGIDYEVDFYLSLGDFFHTTIQTKTFQRDVIRILARAKDHRIPFYTLTGNHLGDVVYKQHTSYKDKDIGLLEEAGLLSVPNLIDTQDAGLIACISAYITLSDFLDTITEAQRQAVTQVAMHYHTQPCFNDPLVLPVKDLKEVFPNLSVIWQGHDHSEFMGTEEGVSICRPGSMLRTDIGKASVRIPRVMIADFNEASEKWLQEVRLDADPYNKVFAVEAHMEQKDYAAELENYMAILGQTQNTTLNIEDYIFTVVDAIKEPDVKSYLLTDLESIGINRRVTT